MSPLPAMLSEEAQTVGALRSTGIPPFHHSAGPFRHPRVFDRWPGGTGDTASLAPAISRWDAEGFSRCSACPCPHAVAPTPPEWVSRVSQSTAPQAAFAFTVAGAASGRLTGGATAAFACATAWRLALIPKMRLSRGFRRLVSRPPALQATGLWLFPWEVSLLLNTPAFAGRTTVQRFFSQALPWARLFWVFFRQHVYRSDEVSLLVGDEVVATKAGKHTHGLDQFFASLYGKPVPGLAFFALSLVSTRQRRSLPIRVEQVVRSDAEKAASKAKAEAKKPTRSTAKRRPGRPKGSKNTPKADGTLTPEL